MSALMNSNCALISAHVHTWALMSMVLWCHERLWVLISANAMAPWRHAHDCSHDFSLLHVAEPICFHGWLWLIMSTHEYPLALLSTQKQPKAARRAHNYEWPLMSKHEYSWPLRNGAISTRGIPQAQEESWSWGHGVMALISTHEHKLRSSTILMSAHEC